MNVALATKLADTFKLDNRVVLITGDSAAAGRDHAQAVVEAGGIALLADSDRDRARDVARDIDSLGTRALAVPLTRGSRESCRLSLAEVLIRFGRVDVLVNGPGEQAPAPAPGEIRTLEDWEAGLAAGCEGAFVATQVFGAHMAERGRGVIVNLASERSNALDKGNLILMTRYFANYWAEDGVRVNALCPGGLLSGRTERFVERLSELLPHGCMSRRDEYRAALVFLAADASSYMNGSTLVTDNRFAS